MINRTTIEGLAKVRQPEVTFAAVFAIIGLSIVLFLLIFLFLGSLVWILKGRRYEEMRHHLIPSAYPSNPGESFQKAEDIELMAQNELPAFYKAGSNE